MLRIPCKKSNETRNTLAVDNPNILYVDYHISVAIYSKLITGPNKHGGIRLGDDHRPGDCVAGLQLLTPVKRHRGHPVGQHHRPMIKRPWWYCVCSVCNSCLSQRRALFFNLRS